MKFVEVAKARGLKFNEPVFVRINGDETPSVGRMLEQKHTAEGIVRTFEVAGFVEDLTTYPDPLKTSLVTHVAIP